VKKIEAHELVSKLKELASELGKTPTTRQFEQSGISKRQINKHGYNNLVKLAGLEPNQTHSPSPEIVIHAWKAKILFLDIETSSLIVRTYGLFNQNIPVGNIVEDWSLLSYAAQFSGEDTIHYMDQRYASHYTDDRQLVEGIHHLMEQADFVAAHNLRFDWGKLNSKFIKYGLKPIHPRQLCTLKMARRLGYFTSNKLEYLASYLGVTPKEKHSKFPGMELWKQCQSGNMEAWEENRLYNIGDIKTLQEIFWILAKYDERINFSVYEHQNTCVCGSKHFIRDGYKVSNGGKKQRFRCGDCGKVYTARVEELSVNIRASLFK
jgi:uncharacterized protein YprB with RNaseH-like and TPR domain